LELKFQTVAEKTAKNFRGYFLLHPVLLLTLFLSGNWGTATDVIEYVLFFSIAELLLDCTVQCDISNKTACR